MRTEGLTFEAHEIGATFRTLGRTVSETDIVTFVNLCGFTEPLFMDMEYVGREAVLRRSDLETLLAPRDVVDALAEAFRRHAAGRTSVPPRGVTPVGDRGMLLVMPAASLPAPGEAEAGGLGAKLVTYYPRNREHGLPIHLASYFLLDHATGEPRALLEAGFMTALRTGATSALAARHLARPDSRRVACFGTGVQARQQLRCLAAIFALERVVVLGRDAARPRGFVEALAAELGVAVEPSHDPRAAAS